MVRGGEPLGESPDSAFCDFASQFGSSVLPLEGVARSSISSEESALDGASTKPL